MEKVPKYTQWVLTFLKLASSQSCFWLVHQQLSKRSLPDLVKVTAALLPQIRTNLLTFHSIVVWLCEVSQNLDFSYHVVDKRFVCPPPPGNG